MTAVDHPVAAPAVACDEVSPATGTAAACAQLAAGVPEPMLNGLLVDACAAPLVLLDRCGHILRVNVAFLRYVGGCTVSDFVGQLASDVLPVEGPRQPFELAARAARAVGEAGDRSVARPESLWTDELGHRRRVAWTFTGVPSGRHPVYVIGTGVDVTRERMAEAGWRQRAETDPLTGLANRAALHAALAAHLELAGGTGCGVVFCDLDGFKAINDTHGHSTGDQVLVEVARRLSDSVRADRGDVVARLGGDEFVLVLPGCGDLELRAVVPRLERAVARPLRLDAGQVRVGISIGTRLADPGDDPTAILADADARMYAAKKARRDRRATPS